MALCRGAEFSAVVMRFFYCGDEIDAKDDEDEEGFIMLRAGEKDMLG